MYSRQAAPAGTRFRMKLRLIEPRRVAEILRRHGITATLAAIAIAGFAALAGVGVIHAHRDASRLALQTSNSAAEQARVILDRLQRVLDRMADIAATSSDEAAQELLNQVPSLMPGIRAAALTDANGVAQLRGGDGLDETAIAALAAEAALSLIHI